MEDVRRCALFQRLSITRDPVATDKASESFLTAPRRLSPLPLECSLASLGALTTRSQNLVGLSCRRPSTQTDAGRRSRPVKADDKGGSRSASVPTARSIHVIKSTAAVSRIREFPSPDSGECGSAAAGA
ncbi:hypothetical protein AAVH_08082 [Aphelenchoides avenae]|nr:hypothetical protein AAVH_08082 [Aphelenchus avenae]